jgi:hypothetical protein
MVITNDEFTPSHFKTKRILMLRKIAIITIVLAQVVCAKAQGIKFGVHADPYLSFLTSNYSNVEASGVNFGVALGVEAAYEFDATGNYALTFGLDFQVNNGGSLLYKYGGAFLPNTQFDNRIEFRNNNDDVPASSTGIPMQAFTKVNHRINYIGIPVGLKLRTNELGDSYMRAFFHIPVVQLMVPLTAGAKIFAPDASAPGFLDDNSAVRYGIPQSTESVTERNTWRDVTPFQLSVGAGAGVEIAPNSDGGLRIYAGIYYHYGIIDITNGFTGPITFSSPDNPNTVISETQSRNPVNALNNVALRLGVVF